MLKSPCRKRSREDWAAVFSEAKEGHVLWDGWAPDPYNPIHAVNSSHDFVTTAESFGFFRPGGKVLDLGCGNGRLGIALSERDIDYLGLDPFLPSIRFCRQAFRRYPRMRFEHIDVRNSHFHPSGGVQARAFRIDAPDDSFQDVIAYSVFTHLETLESARNYVAEICRVLKPGGHLFTSWYRSPPNLHQDQTVGRTVYNEWDIMTMLSGFSCDFSYGGHTDKYYDQWAIFSTQCEKS